MTTTKSRLLRFSVLLITALVALTVVSSARAEEKTTAEVTTNGDDYGYKFDDESLLGSTLASSGDLWGGRKRFQRVILVRPRTDMRPQLLKSVENL